MTFHLGTFAIHFYFHRIQKKRQNIESCTKNLPRGKGELFIFYFFDCSKLIIWTKHELIELIWTIECGPGPYGYAK